MCNAKVLHPNNMHSLQNKLGRNEIILLKVRLDSSHFVLFSTFKELLFALQLNPINTTYNNFFG